MGPPNKSDIEALVAFPPLFALQTDQSLGLMIYRESDAHRVRAPYMDYDETVSEFFRLVGEPPWADNGYVPYVCGRLIEEGFIERAPLQELVSLLTYCERGERFCDGHWLAMIEDGEVCRILKRLTAFLSGA